MDPCSKTSIIENFMNIEYIKKAMEAVFITSPSPENEVDLEFVEKYANLFNTIGTELIESYKKVTGKSMSNDNMNELHLSTLISNAIESKFTVLCQFLSHSELTVSQKVHNFTREYIQWVRSNVKNGDVSVLEQKTALLLSIIVEKSKYPPDFESMDEEFFEEYRKSTKVLFDNLLLLNAQTVFNFVSQKVIVATFMNWKAQSVTFPEIEASLYYFYVIGENMTLVGNNKNIEGLVDLLITSSISSYPNEITQSFYFDLIFRYEKILNSSMSYLLSPILISFLDERGIRNPNMKIRSKVCRLFNKFVKGYIKSKSNVDKQNFTEDILKRIQEFLKTDIAFDSSDDLNELGLERLMSSPLLVKQQDISFVHSISKTDQLHIYETVTFLIISNQNYDPNRKKQLLDELFKSIWDEFEKLYKNILSLSSAISQNGFLDSNNKKSLSDNRLILVLQLTHCINIISATSKSFSNVNTVKTIGVQNLYLQSFDLFLKTFNLNVDQDCQHLLQSCIRLYLHRLIVCLDEDEIIPLLPNSIQTLFLANDITSKSIQELVPLFTQIVPKYKCSWMFERDMHPFLAQIFSPLITLFIKLIIASNNESDKSALQRSYYLFLHILFTNNLVPGFFDLGKSAP